MKTKTSHIRNLIPLVLSMALFALPPAAHATCREGCGGFGNTFLGEDALPNTGGFNNTAIGSSALQFNTNGVENTATGDAALNSNTLGSSNTAIGSHALQLNTTGNQNTATGEAAIELNTTGNYNTANGYFALWQNTTGNYNTTTGHASLPRNTTGTNNTADGHFALHNNTIGSFNIALGDDAGSSLTTGNNNIDIGNRGLAGEDNKIRIGTTGTQTATFIAGISGVTVPDGVGVLVGSDGKLGTMVSSARYKDNVQPMDKASEAILALKPVTFRYKHKLDPVGIPQFGLVAEEVERVNPDLVAHDEQGKPYSVRYEAVNAMLLNEFLKEHRKVESLEKAIAEQQQENAAMRAMLKEQAAQIQKVSAQVEVSSSGRAPQIVDNQ
jgi:hypothetical protein